MESNVFDGTTLKAHLKACYERTEKGEDGSRDRTVLTRKLKASSRNAHRTCR